MYPVRGLAMVAVAALALDAGVTVGAAVIDLRYADLVDRVVVDAGAVPEAELARSHLVHAFSGVVMVLAYLVAVVAFLAWFYRVRVNAEILAPYGHRRSRPWAIAGWLVPVIAFWFPKQAMDDIWYASQPGGGRRGQVLIDAWWMFWLVGNLVATVVARVLVEAFSRGDGLGRVAYAARVDVAGLALMLIAAVLAIGVVLLITNAQEEYRAGARS
ncbi:DUF4328 domain-containing protein [Nonomuraea sp. NPDC048826]|uniref:DUF4328 domain-containing protein n=1 Tax=Nonomuraea sp. NPDC048826 TaxID=3364347 RepID=UPI003720B323